MRGLLGPLGPLDQRRERLAVLHGQIGEHLAVHFDPCPAQPEDQAAIGEPVRARRRIDARDPQLAELPLPGAPVRVRLGQRTLHRLVGQFEPAALLAPVPTGQPQHLSVPAANPYSPFDARHGRSLPMRSSNGLPVRQQRPDPGDVGGVDRTLLPQRPLALGSLVDHQVPTQLAPPEEPPPAGHPDPLGGALVGLELSHYVLFGAMIMIMLRPSINGCRSTTPKSANSCAIRRRICSPTWGCAISLPRNHFETRTLSPSLRNPITALVFTCRSCSPIFGLNRMPFSPELLDFLCAPR